MSRSPRFATVARQVLACLAGALLAATPALAAINTHKVTVSASGAEGSGTGSADAPVVNGYLEAIYLDFSATATGTMDVTVAHKTRGGNVLVTTNTITDALKYPRAKPVDNANAAITDANARFCLNDQMTITVAEASSSSAEVVVYFYVSDR
jgi:hypothetical protein